MLKCNVCGHEFDATIENHYIARNNGYVGITAGLGSYEEETLYDAFDCPKCGCQHITQERKRSYSSPSKEDENE